MNIFKRLHINRVVRSFIISDLVLFSGWGLISPIFAIFITEQVRGATLETVGVVTAIYWLVRSLTEIPLATALDKIRGEKDDFYTLVAGLTLAAVASFLYVFVRTVPQLYAVQALQAFAFTLYAPSWSGIFSRHLDRDKTAISWSLDHTFLGVASGVTGYLGSITVAHFGYKSIFVIAAILSIVAAIIIFLIPDIVFPRPKRLKALSEVRDHSVKTIQ
ncbi:MAG: MFS transporter [Patescibacteria group bacterium]|nr:MFS transporter [Patescibacteria group bacterium]MCL5262139.1 MFS transporter [Patescibacteria group bacterium]